MAAECLLLLDPSQPRWNDLNPKSPTCWTFSRYSYTVYIIIYIELSVSLSVSLSLVLSLSLHIDDLCLNLVNYMVIMYSYIWYDLENHYTIFTPELARGDFQPRACGV